MKNKTFQFLLTPLCLLACLFTALVGFNSCERERELVVATISSTMAEPQGSGLIVASTVKYSTEDQYYFPTIEYYGAYVTAADPAADKETYTFIEKNTEDILRYFELKLSGLDSDTKYNIQTFIRNSYGEVLGEVVSATTLSTVKVTTGSASDVSAHSAKLSGSVVAASGNENYKVSQRGFVVSATNQSPTVEDNLLKATVSGTTGSYAYTCTNLTSGKKYYYRAYAEVNGEILYGASKNFTTLVADDAIEVNITEFPSNTITDHSFNIRGKISIGKDAVGTIKEVGFVCATHSSPTKSDIRSMIYWQAGKSEDEYGDVATWSGMKELLSFFTALSSYTTYYCRMYYTLNDGKTYYSAAKSVTTAGGSETGGTLTVAQFKNKPDDINTWYTVSGVIYKIENTQYGNFYLADETGLLTVYGLTATQRTTNDQSFGSLGLKEGDYITIKAPKVTFQGSPEAKNGYLVSKSASVPEFTTYALEPTSTSNLTLANPTVSTVWVSDYPEATHTYNYCYVYVYIYDGLHLLCLNVNFHGLHDTETVIPPGTYSVIETMMGSVWGSNGVERSDGFGGFQTMTYFEYNSSTFGLSCPYFVTDGYITVSKSGTKTRLQLHLTTYYGSTIQGDITEDLLSKMNLTTQ